MNIVVEVGCFYDEAKAVIIKSSERKTLRSLLDGSNKADQLQLRIAAWVVNFADKLKRTEFLELVEEPLIEALFKSNLEGFKLSQELLTYFKNPEEIDLYFKPSFGKLSKIDLGKLKIRIKRPSEPVSDLKELIYETNADIELKAFKDFLLINLMD